MPASPARPFTYSLRLPQLKRISQRCLAHGALSGVDMDFSSSSSTPGKAPRRARKPSVKAFWLIGAWTAFSAVAHAQTQTLASSAGKATSPTTSSATSAVAAACPPILQHTFARLQDEKPQALCQYAGKVLLVVNTASFCGFTQQYAGLEALSARYRGQGLVVLGFPSNDFSQESGSNKEIASFCENTFNVKFPMFAKSTVSGRHASPLFKQLADSGGGLPRWNFHKYVISRDGRTITSFGSAVEPSDPRVRQAIEKSLLAK